MAVVKQVGDLAFDSLLSVGLFAMGLGRPTLGKLWKGGFQFPANLGDRLEDGLGDLGEDVKLTDLVTNLAEDRGNGPWIQR
jgi:hypothetical protein